MATSPATTPDEALVREISASGSEPDWLAAHRLDSLARHAALPAPALTDERWRRTDLRGLDPAAFTAASRNGQPDATATAAMSGAAVNATVRRAARARARGEGSPRN